MKYRWLNASLLAALLVMTIDARDYILDVSKGINPIIKGLIVISFAIFIAIAFIWAVGFEGFIFKLLKIEIK